MRKAKLQSNKPNPSLHAADLIGCFLVALFLTGGCAGWIGQQWSENYAQLPGTHASSAKFIDGDLSTAAPLTFRFDPRQPISYPTAEAEIALPEPQTIRRVLIHSDDLRDFQLWAYDSEAETWQPVYESKGRSEKDPIEIRTKIHTQRLKLKVNMINVLGGRNVVEQALKGESDLGDGQGLLERLIGLVSQAARLDASGQVQIKLPEVREISLYGLE